MSLKQAPKLVILIASVVAAASAMQASGLTAELGASPSTGVESDVNQSADELEGIAAERGEADSFIGSVIASMDELSAVTSILVALPILLMNLGLPEWAAALIGFPIPFVVGFFLISVLRGVEVG